MQSEHASQRQEITPVAVIITLKEFITRLEAQEAAKPPRDRRAVPTIPELAEAADITRQGMYNFASGKIKMMNLDILSAVINEFRRRGFEVDVADLLTAFPADSVRHQ